MLGANPSNYSNVVDSRAAAETVSICYIHCLLKGLHKAPRICDFSMNVLSVKDVDCLITPIGCYGSPHSLCTKRRIPIIAVKENAPYNKSIHSIEDTGWIYVENYLEAAGVIISMKAGVTIESVRRPLPPTEII